MWTVYHWINNGQEQTNRPDQIKEKKLTGGYSKYNKEHLTVQVTMYSLGL